MIMRIGLIKDAMPSFFSRPYSDTMEDKISTLFVIQIVLYDDNN